MTSTGALERAKAAFIVTSATRAVLAFDVHWALTFSLWLGLLEELGRMFGPIESRYEFHVSGLP